MSHDIAWDALNLRMTDRPAHTEYCIHHPLIERVTGLPKDHPDRTQRLAEVWQMDIDWLAHDGPALWKDLGRVTDMGHAEFLADSSDKHDALPSPFESLEEVFAFDALQEYAPPPLDELAAFYEDLHGRRQAAAPTMLLPGGYYKTIVSGAILAFGWDMLLRAAAQPVEFERVLDSIFRLSLHHYKAWARTSIKYFISHDDMVWTEGAFLHPDFYRRVIFPRYAKLWAPLKEAGKKVLFCSDGQYTEFLEDIAAAGADGFMFEPLTSMERAVEKFGKTHVIASSKVDCRTLTFGTKEDIKAEVDASLKLGLPCPGWIAVVGNHIAPNVPIENALFYIDYLTTHWKR